MEVSGSDWEGVLSDDRGRGLSWSYGGHLDSILDFCTRRKKRISGSKRWVKETAGKSG